MKTHRWVLYASLVFSFLVAGGGVAAWAQEVARPPEPAPQTTDVPRVELQVLHALRRIRSRLPTRLR